MTDDIDQDRQDDLEAAYDYLIKNVELDELDNNSGLEFGSNPNWCLWAAEVTDVGLEVPECKKLHYRIRVWIKQERQRILSPR